MAVIARIFIVLFAFALACLAAAAVMTFALLFPDWNNSLAPPVDQQIIEITLGLSALFFSVYAVLPAMVIIAVAEGFRLRSVLFYTLVSAALTLWLAYGWDLRALRNSEDDAAVRGVEIAAAMGIVAGFVYWALAGRNAGAWRKPPNALNPARSVGAPK